MTNLSPKQLSSRATLNVYRLANLDAPDRTALLAAFDNQAAKHSEVKDWINTLPLKVQIELYQGVREGLIDSFFDKYKAYRDKHGNEPMNAFQSMWIKKALIDQTSLYYQENGNLEATEFNTLVSDLSRMALAIYEATPQEDIEIPF